MKKRDLFIPSLVILSLLLISTISAVEIKLSKNSYQPMETLQVEITGNFIDSLSKSNVLLYKEGIPHSTPAISDLTKYEDINYFYAILPNQEGNFSLKIENVRYVDAGTQKTETIEKKFIIKKGNQSALQINPGFVNTGQDFSIDVTNLYGNDKILASFNKETKNLSIIPDSKKIITFSIKNITSGKQELTINGYKIPVFIIGKPIINTSINQTNQTNQNKTNTTLINQTNQTQPKINITNKTDIQIEEMHCSDFGYLCEDGEKCDSGTKSSLEGPCCLGTCVKPKETSYSWIFGVLLIIVVLGVVGYSYFKVKNRRPPTSEDILKKRSNQFEGRMSGDNKEVNGKLDSI